MRLIPLQQPFRAVAAGGSLRPAAFTFSRAQRRPELLCSASAPHRLDDGGKIVEGRRNAAVKSQGAYKLTNKKTIAKKLGAKKSGDQYVLPGNIIYKQRGTVWHPGENTIMGRDHTIHAAVTGYVKYYRDPARHPKRQFIGVAFNRDDKLPYPSHGVRRRKLGMVAVPRREPAPLPALSPSGIPTRVVRKEGAAPTEEELADPSRRFKKGRARVLRELAIRRNNRVLLLQKDYSYRESNVAIGKLMGKHKGKTPGTVRVGSRKAMFRAKIRARSEDRAIMKRERKEAAERAKAEQEKAAAKKEAAAKKAADALAKAKAKAAKAKAEMDAKVES